MFKNSSKAIATLVLVASTLSIGLTTSSARAKPLFFPKGPLKVASFHHNHHGWGAPAAIGLGLGVAGILAASAAYASAPADDVEYGRVCRMERQFDNDGFYMGRARVCRTVAY